MLSKKAARHVHENQSDEPEAPWASMPLFQEELNEVCDVTALNGLDKTMNWYQSDCFCTGTGYKSHGLCAVTHIKGLKRDDPKFSTCDIP